MAKSQTVFRIAPATNRKGIGSGAFLRVWLERNINAGIVDGAGTITPKWEGVKKLWAERVATATSFSPKLRQQVETRIEIFRIRWGSLVEFRNELNAGAFRLREGSVVWDIRGIRTDTDDRQFVDIDCELGRDVSA